MELHQWLTQTTASEVMFRDVDALDRKTLLAEAAETLLRRQVSGAPVVDATGVCVGVLSISDIVRADEEVAVERRNIANASFWQANLALPVSIYEEKLAEVREKTAAAGEQPVERFMVTDIVSVRADAAIGTVIKYMIEAHIHRVVVLDEQRRLEGIVSTTDVLAAMVRAAAN